MSEPQLAQQLVQMIVGSWVSRAIYVAAKLQIADLLTVREMTTDTSKFDP